MPFLTEEICRKLNSNEESLIQTDWPKTDEKLIDKKSSAEMGFLKEFIRAVRNLRAEMNIPETSQIEVQVVCSAKEKQIIDSGNEYIRKLAKVEKISVSDKLKEAPDKAATAIVGQVKIYAPLKGLIDIEKEVARLKTELEKTVLEIAKVEKKLENPQFLEKGDPKVVEKEKEKIGQLKTKQATLKERIKDLS